MLEARERLLGIALRAIALGPQTVLDQAELGLLEQLDRRGKVEQGLVLAAPHDDRDLAALVEE